jgi:hypothetical protein
MEYVQYAVGPIIGLWDFELSSDISYVKEYQVPAFLEKTYR